MSKLHDIETIEDYLQAFGSILGSRADDQLATIHVPGRDPSIVKDGDFLRSPNDPQRHVITSAVKTLDARSSLFLVGEMGTGKTLIAACTIHAHSKGKPYRAVVVCPDHIISKWKRELEITIPGARVTTIQKWHEILAFLDCKSSIKGRWKKPTSPEWLVLGRNQIKFIPDRLSCGESPRTGRLVVKTKLVEREADSDDRGRRSSRIGNYDCTTEMKEIVVCPRCGAPQTGKNGEPLTRDKIMGKGDSIRRCDATILRQVAVRERESGLDMIKSHESRAKINGAEYVRETCGEPLWSYSAKPWRYPAATILQRKLKKLFKYCVLDEVHEAKSDTSARSLAAGRIASVCQKTLALTGTLIGGRADHLFPLMMRLTPATLKAEGFEWGRSKDFSREYGMIETVVTTRSGGDDSGYSKRSAACGKTRTSPPQEKIRPGIMPHLYGRHLLGSSIFFSLDQMADDLPGFEPIVEACSMDDELEEAYKFIEAKVRSENADLIRQGNRAFLGGMLHTLYRYPDMPFDWVPRYEGRTAVGYYNDRIHCAESWVDVIQPTSLSSETVRPKEWKLIEICTHEKRRGNQVWVFCQMTAKMDVRPRLQSLLENEGLTVRLMSATAVPPTERERWIERNGKGVDVIISNPALVETGLDLFLPGSHNFSTLVFYQTGYNLFTLRQASRRAWRLGQTKDCKVYFLYYRGTMQETAMALMGAKLAAAEAVDGKFSTEGLAAMGGGSDDHMALTKMIYSSMEDMRMAWSKIGSRPGRSFEAMSDPLISVGGGVIDSADSGSTPTILPIESARRELEDRRKPTNLFEALIAAGVDVGFWLNRQA